MNTTDTKEYLPINQALISQLAGTLIFVGIIMTSFGLVGLSEPLLRHEMPSLNAWMFAVCGVITLACSTAIHERVGWFR